MHLPTKGHILHDSKGCVYNVLVNILRVSMLTLAKITSAVRNPKLVSCCPGQEGPRALPTVIPPAG